MIIKLPLAVFLSRKTMPDKKCTINLNYYRNWKFFVSNQIKEVYKECLEDTLKNLRFKGKITLIFTLYWGSKRRVDRSNVLSIQEKFFCDALTFYGCIADDNDNYIEETRYRTGEIDRENPRVEVEIINN
jgi:hypothetical protein